MTTTQILMVMGLADWEETLGVFGYFSNPTLVDSDGDGEGDFDEINGGTDPLEPCTNSLGRRP
ncbi:MAG: hypothetical protein CM15mP71_4790 [Candidatus Poseidoniales archaeon]|nr:MAG: hypothetical protein CM15mP71_4790 [Candidatus Poseidoniales archaeon]